MVPGGSDLGWGAPCRGPGGGFSARGGGRTSGQEGMGAQSRQAPGTALSRLLGKGLRGESAAGLSRGEVHEAWGPGENHVDLCPVSKCPGNHRQVFRGAERELWGGRGAKESAGPRVQRTEECGPGWAGGGGRGDTHGVCHRGLTGESPVSVAHSGRSADSRSGLRLGNTEVRVRTGRMCVCRGEDVEGAGVLP